MDTKTQERYAKAMQRFINEVEEKIEGKVEDWLNDNPYWEFDDEDEHGHRVFRCPPTRSSDAREALSEDFIVSGEEVEHKNCTDFFEFVINEIYGFPMGNRNPYREQPKTIEPEIKEAFVDHCRQSLTPTEQAIAEINKGTATFIDEICGVKRND